MKPRSQNPLRLVARSSSLVGLCTISFCVLSAGHARAQATWDGGGTADGLGNYNWADGFNWLADSAPVSGDSLTFSGTVNTATSFNNITADTSFAGITFDDTAGEFILSGNRITLDGNVVNNDADLQTINLDMVMTATRTFETASGSILLGGILSGSGGLTKTGAETLILTGNNSYSGDTTINAESVLRAGHNNAFGSNGSIALQGTNATLELANGITINRALTIGNTGGNKVIRLQDTAASGEYSGDITVSETGAGNFDLSASANGTLTVSGTIGASAGANINKEGAGTVVLSGNNSLFDRNVTINAGVLRAAHNNAFGSTGTVTLGNTDATLELADGITINRALTVSNTGDNKTLALQTGATSAIYSGNITVSEVSAGNFDLSASANGTLTVSGTIGASAAAGINKEGSGTVVLSGDNALFDRNVTINAGVLRAGHNNAFGSTGSVTLSNTDATLELANGITINRALTISDTGDKKTLALQTGASSAIYSGDVTNSETTAGNFEVSVGSSGTLTLSGFVKSNTVTKVGEGTLVLSGATDNSFLLLNATEGEVHLGKDLASNVRAVSGIIGISSSATVKLTGTGTDQIFGGGSTNQGVNGIVAGGTLDLNGKSESVSFLNGTGGTVDGAVTGGSGNNTLTVGQNDVSSVFDGVIKNTAGTLNLTKTGTGTQTLGGANTYSGTTSVNAGKLIIDGSTAAGSAVSVGVSGTLGGTGTINGTLAVTGMLAPGDADVVDIETLNAGTTTWNGGSIWEFDLSPTDNTSDQLAITGDLTKGTGTGYAFNFMGAKPAWNTTFTLATWTGMTTFVLADFDAAASRATLGTGSYSTSFFTLNSGSLTFTAVPEPSSALAGLLITAGLLRRRRA